MDCACSNWPWLPTEISLGQMGRDERFLKAGCFWTEFAFYPLPPVVQKRVTGKSAKPWGKIFSGVVQKKVNTNLRLNSGLNLTHHASTALAKWILEFLGKNSLEFPQ